MRYILILLVILISSTVTSQKVKKRSIQAYQHTFPTEFLPEGYTSYSSIVNLNGGTKKVYIDGEYERDSNPIQYNEFWKEEDVYVSMALFPYLKFELDPNVKKADKLLIKVDVSNARIDAKIKESKNSDTPFTYEYRWSVDVTTHVENSLSGEVIYNHTDTYGGRQRLVSNKKGFKGKFKTYDEAKAYVSKDADKNTIGNNFYQKMSISGGYYQAFNVGFYYADPVAFWKISKEKKFPKAGKLNRILEETDQRIKILNKKQKEIKGATDVKLAKRLIRENKSISFKVTKDTLGLWYKRKLKETLEPIKIESNKLISELNSSDKKEKTILWGMYMNKAAVAYLSGAFDEALLYLENAEELEHKKSHTKSFKRKIKLRLTSFNLLKEGKTRSGMPMLDKYNVYITGVD